MRNYFPKHTSGAPLHTLSKSYDIPVGFVTPPPQPLSFEAEYCYVYGRRKFVVARHRMICLVLDLSKLFLYKVQVTDSLRVQLDKRYVRC